MINSLTASLTGLRSALDGAFAEDTTQQDDETRRIGWRNFQPSTGHCTVASILVRTLFGGDFMSTKIRGVSHWFNSIPVYGRLYEADITGDQFGLARIQVTLVGSSSSEGIYPASRVRHVDDINGETWSRYRLFLSRLDPSRPADAFEEEVHARCNDLRCEPCMARLSADWTEHAKHCTTIGCCR